MNRQTDRRCDVIRRVPKIYINF